MTLPPLRWPPCRWQNKCRPRPAQCRSRNHGPAGDIAPGKTLLLGLKNDRSNASVYFALPAADGSPCLVRWPTSRPNAKIFFSTWRAISPFLPLS
jgi:hypothetical protein